MDTFWILLLCILAFAGVLVGAVATIVLAILKKTHGWRIGLALTLLFLLTGGVSGIVLLVRGTRAVSEIAAQAGEKIEDFRKEQAAQQKRYEGHMVTLKGFVAPDILSTVDPMYWENLGAWDWYRFPTVYPYSIEAIDTLDHGMLTIWDAKRAREGGGFASLVSGITDFSFDQRFLIARTEPNHGYSREPKEVSWVLFDFQTRKSETFTSQEELEQAATERGYQGNLELKSVREGYEACCH